MEESKIIVNVIQVRIPQTPEDKEENTRLLLDLMDEKSQVESAKKASVGLYKSELEELNKRTQETYHRMRDGHKLVPVKCRREVDLDNEVLSWVRMDTGIVVETRQMTTSEITEARQGVLPGIEEEVSPAEVQRLGGGGELVINMGALGQVTVEKARSLLADAEREDLEMELVGMKDGDPITAEMFSVVNSLLREMEKKPPRRKVKA